MFAIISDSDEIVELLLRNKANASITDDNERTPLFIAVQYSNFDQKNPLRIPFEHILTYSQPFFRQRKCTKSITQKWS